MHKKLPPNLVGNDYVVGDIHGMFTLLYKNLMDLNFDPEKDRLFSVGDLVDRGRESDKVLYLLNKPWFYSVRGNHEDLTILAHTKDLLHIDNHVRNGGLWFQNITTEKQNQIVAKFKELPILIETSVDGKSIGFAHGDIGDWSIDVQEIKDLTLEDSLSNYTCNKIQWGRGRVKSLQLPSKGIDHVFLGHTPLKEPITKSNCTFIDTGACFGYDLTILNINQFIKEML